MNILQIVREVGNLKKPALSVSAIVSAVILIGASARASNIATIQSQSSGTSGLTLDSGPTVTAIMSQPGTVGGHTYISWAVLAQDTTGSIELFSSPASFGSYVPAVGDVISASGTYTTFDQIPEFTSLTSISLTSRGNPVPASPVATIAGLNSSLTIPQTLAGYPVQLDNVSIYTDSAATIPASGNFTAANTTFYLKDAGNNIMPMYFWYTAYSREGALVGTPIPNAPIDVVGLLSQSGSSAVEITPYSFTAVPEPSSIALAGLGLLGLLAVRRRQR